MEPCYISTPYRYEKCLKGFFWRMGQIRTVPKRPKRKERKMIRLTLKDNSTIEVEQGTTILEVAKKISEGLARVATCGEIDGEIKDLRYEIQKDGHLTIHTFSKEDLEGKKAYWHTT